jgi:hypothetical protein
MEERAAGAITGAGPPGIRAPTPPAYGQVVSTPHTFLQISTPPATWALPLPPLLLVIEFPPYPSLGLLRDSHGTKDAGHIDLVLVEGDEEAPGGVEDGVASED